MNEILKYWPINFAYNGDRMMLPMGQIINIRDVGGNAQFEVHGDTWSSETKYDEVMTQWAQALKRFAPEPNQKWEVT